MYGVCWIRWMLLLHQRMPLGCFGLRGVCSGYIWSQGRTDWELGLLLLLTGQGEGRQMAIYLQCLLWHMTHMWPTHTKYTGHWHLQGDHASWATLTRPHNGLTGSHEMFHQWLLCRCSSTKRGLLRIVSWIGWSGVGGHRLEWGTEWSEGTVRSEGDQVDWGDRVTSFSCATTQHTYPCAVSSSWLHPLGASLGRPSLTKLCHRHPL